MSNQTNVPVGPSFQASAGDHVRNIAVDLILTIITCGLFNLWVQYKQIEAVNHMLRQNKYSFIMWFILTLITCGLYHIYHEYVKTMDIMKALNQPEGPEAIISIVLTVFGLSVVADAIQQASINRYYGNTSL